MSAAAQLARRLAEAAATATDRHPRPRTSPPPPAPTVPPAPETAPETAPEPAAAPVAPGDVPTGWKAYDRAIWPLGDDGCDGDDCILVEGTDRRSHAALNHYLRDGVRPHYRRDRHDRPRINTGRISFHRVGENYRVEHHTADTAGPGLLTVLVADR